MTAALRCRHAPLVLGVLAAAPAAHPAGALAEPPAAAAGVAADAAVPVEERLYLRERPRAPGEAAAALDPELERLLVEREAAVAARRAEAIALLESLVDTLPEEATALPDALLRLAELRWEQARAEWLTAYGRWQQAPEPGRGPAPRPDYGAAMALYDRLLARHPTFERLDLVLYMKAAAHLEREEDAEALALHRRILREHPDGRFAADASFALAEFHFAREQDFGAALARYEAVLTRPDAPMFDVALFKSAWCLWRLDRTAEAAVRFRRVLDLARESRGLDADRRRRLRELEDEALDTLVEVFVENEGNAAGDVFAFLEAIGGERYAIVVLERLAETFYAQTRYERGIEAWALLIDSDPGDPDAPMRQAAIADGHAALDDEQATIAALERLASAYAPGGEWARQQGDPERVDAAVRLAEARIRRLALRWHQEGQRDDRASRFEHAAALYAVYLAHFGDRPEAYTLQFYRAEILFHRLERWGEAGDAYLAAARLRPDGELTRDALYNGIGAFEEVRERGERCAAPTGGAADARATTCGETENDRKLGEAIALYVDLFPDDPDLPEVLFRQGKLYHDRRVFDPAVRLFGQLVERFPASPYAERAGELLLDAFNQAQDWGNIETWARRLKGTAAFAAPEKQRRLDGLILQAVFKSGEQLAERGEHGAAAEAYLRAAGEFPEDPRAAQAYYNAGLARQRSGDLAGAESAFAALVDRHPGAEEGALGAWAAAQMYESIAQFEDAARWYEAYEERFPDAPRAADALYDATLLRVTTGEHDRAVANGERFVGRFPRHEVADEVVFLVGRAHEGARRWEEAAAVYTRFVRATRDLDRKVEATTRLAQVLARAGDDAGAARALDAAVRLGKRHARRLGPGLHFAAQARFLEGQAVLARYEAVRIDGDVAGLRARLQEKSRLLAQAAAVFAEVVRFGVAEWVTAALYEIGRSYESFADALRDAPVPPGLSEEERQVYLDQLAMFVVPIEERALEAFEGGYAKALELRIFNRWTAELREALTRLNDVQYPPLRETGLALVEGDPLVVPPPIAGAARGSPGAAAAAGGRP